MKQCPYCAEEIQAAAIKCKHCGEMLKPEHQSKAKPKSTGVGFQRSASDKKILKFIGISFGVLFLIATPQLIIPVVLGVGGWMLYKRPALRNKLVVRAKALWPHVKRYKLPIAIIAGLFVLWAGISARYAVAAPELTLPGEYTFSGNEVEVTGQVKNNCRCNIEVTVNDKAAELQNDGSFRTAIPVTADINTGDIKVKTRTTGGLFNKKTVETAEAKNFRRSTATVELISPKEFGDKTTELKIKGQPNAVVIVKTKPEKQLTLDAEGNGTVQVPFDTTYNKQSNTYTLAVKLAGFADGQTDVQVTNLKYDAKRVAEEAAAEAERKRVDDIVESMDNYTNTTPVKIAVYKDIKKSRSVGYRYALDSQHDQFIRFGLSVKNVGDGEHHVNPNNVTVQDSSGHTYTPDIATYGLGNYLDAVNILPGAEAGGWLAFIVPKDEKELTVIYSSFDGIVTKNIYVK